MPFHWRSKVWRWSPNAASPASFNQIRRAKAAPARDIGVGFSRERMFDTSSSALPITTAMGNPICHMELMICTSEVWISRLPCLRDPVW